MGVAREVGEHRLGSAEGLLRIDHPFCASERGEESSERCGLCERCVLAEELETDRLEIAHVQYYGWALRNQEALLPTRDQWERSLAIITAARERLKGRMRVDFVAPDYYAKYPKAWCHPHRSRRTCVALPCRRLDSRSGVRQRPVTHAALDLGRVLSVSEVPRRRLDARAVP